MNKSLPDVILPRGKWVNGYEATGIEKGKPLVIQNKGRRSILVWESSKLPDRNQRDGEMLNRGERTRVLNGSAGVWIICRSDDGRAFIQETPT